MLKITKVRGKVKNKGVIIGLIGLISPISLILKTLAFIIGKYEDGWQIFYFHFWVPNEQSRQ